MIKVIFRLVALIAISGLILTVLSIISSSVRECLKAYESVSALGVILVVFSIFLLWGYTFYHWGVHEFTSRKLKIIWFWVILLGAYLGAFIYYLLVCEIGRGIKRTQEK